MTIKQIISNRGFKRRKKLELLKSLSPKLFSEISSFCEQEQTILYCFSKEIYEQPICQLNGCSEFAQECFGKFSKGCCKKHSQMITSLERYGTENPMQSKEIQKKHRNSILKNHGVKNYFSSESMKEKLKKDNPMFKICTKEKVRKTNLERYGVENPMQSKEISKKVQEKNKKSFHLHQEKIQKTNLNRFGVKNPLSDPSIHQKSVETKRGHQYFNRISNFSNIKPLFDLEDYHGVDFYEWKCALCDSIFSFKIEDGHIPICRKCFPFEKLPYSKGEKELVRWFREIGLEVIENDRIILKGKELDILIPSKNLAIEFNGVYWHSERRKDKSYHLNKLEECLEQGIDLIQVYDVHWKKKEEIVKSIILRKLKSLEKPKGFKIIEIEEKHTKAFLEENYIFDDFSFERGFGLFLEKELHQILLISEYTVCQMISKKDSYFSFDVLGEFLKNYLSHCSVHFDRNYFNHEKLKGWDLEKTEPELIEMNTERIWNSGENVFTF